MTPHARRIAVAAIAVLAPLALSPAASAAQTTLASSTFGVNAEGWTVGDFYNTAAALTAPTYVATGGNPGGFIRTADVSDWVAFVAPAAYLGNQSAAYGGTLTFDMQTFTTTGFFNNGELLHLSGGGLELYYDPGVVQPGTSWTSFTVGFMPSAAWVVGQGGPAATAAQMQAALASVTGLRIQADVILNADRTDLDNVVLTSAATTVPEPTTVALMGSGLALLGGVAARRRKRA